jgi:hypothetical protein
MKFLNLGYKEKNGPYPVAGPDTKGKAETCYPSLYLSRMMDDFPAMKVGQEVELVLKARVIEDGTREVRTMESKGKESERKLEFEIREIALADQAPAEKPYKDRLAAALKR